MPTIATPSAPPIASGIRPWPVIWRSLFVLGLVFAIPMHLAAQDPVLGTWRWDITEQDKTHATYFTFLPDGTAVQKGRSGVWTCLDSTSPTPTYRITWMNGKFLDTLSLTGNGQELNGHNQFKFRLHAVRISAPSGPSTTASTSTSSTTSVPAVPQSCIERFSEQLPKAAEWTMAPLEVPVPGTVRETIQAMNHGLRDEAAHCPQATLATYQLGVKLCQILDSVLLERAAMLQRNAQLNNGADVNDLWKKNWQQRVFATGPALETSFTQFQQAMQSSPKSTVAVLTDRRAAFDLPAMTIPEAPAAPSEKSGAEGQNAPPLPSSPAREGGTGLQSANGGLNRGAYDERYIWTWRRWTYWRY